MMRRLFSTDDWLARHPRLLFVLMFVLYIFVCSVENW